MSDKLDAAAQTMIDNLVSHRVRLSQANEVDEELIGWLRPRCYPEFFPFSYAWRKIGALTLCRNIKPLFNFEPPTTEAEIAAATQTLLDSLTTNALKRRRDQGVQ